LIWSFVGSALAPNSVITFPLTVTRPSASSFSPFLLEAIPLWDKIFWILISTLIVVWRYGECDLDENIKRRGAATKRSYRSGDLTEETFSKNKLFQSG
jgi:hypothetical protein